MGGRRQSAIKQEIVTSLHLPIRQRDASGSEQWSHDTCLQSLLGTSDSLEAE